MIFKCRYLKSYSLIAPTAPQAEPGYKQTELCDCSGSYCKGCWGEACSCTRPFVWYSLASRIKSKNTGIMFLIIALLYFVVSSIWMYKYVKNWYNYLVAIFGTAGDKLEYGDWQGYLNEMSSIHTSIYNTYMI